MNITHLRHLFRAYLIESKRTLLICSLISFGLLALAFATNAMPEILPITPYLITLWIAGSFFQFSLKKNNSVHFFNLPVTTAEKFIHAILTTLLIGIGIHLIAFVGAYIGYYLIHPLLHINIDKARWIANDKMSIWNQLIMHKKAYWFYGASLAALLFGSIYFKTKAIVKSLSSGLGFLFGIALYFWALFSITFWKDINSIHQYNGSMDFNLADSPFWYEHYYIAPIALIVFFLSLTYLRLRETEV
jgi:hypothetical protein